MNSTYQHTLNNKSWKIREKCWIKMSRELSKVMNISNINWEVWLCTPGQPTAVTTTLLYRTAKEIGFSSMMKMWYPSMLRNYLIRLLAADLRNTRTRLKMHIWWSMKGSNGPRKNNLMKRPYIIDKPINLWSQELSREMDSWERKKLFSHRSMSTWSEGWRSLWTKSRAKILLKQIGIDSTFPTIFLSESGKTIFSILCHSHNPLKTKWWTTTTSVKLFWNALLLQDLLKKCLSTIQSGKSVEYLGICLE